MDEKIAFIFPGQGSQSVGMGQELIANYSEAEPIFEKAEDILGFDLQELCFNGPKTKLNNTKYTQPAVFTISYIIYQILNKQGIEPEIVAGHSLGEYSALAAAGAFSFEEGLKLVQIRGRLMDEETRAEGSMAAIIGLSPEEVDSICEDVQGILEVANYNSPQQIVISGQKSAVKDGMDLAEEKGAKKTVELNVSGAFHSSLMAPVQEKMRDIIETTNIDDTEIPVVLNISAESVTGKPEIKKELLLQLTNSVQWQKSIEFMINEGVETFIEVGPGRVLRGLLRRIDRSVTCYSTRSGQKISKIKEKV